MAIRSESPQLKQARKALSEEHSCVPATDREFRRNGREKGSNVAAVFERRIVPFFNNTTMVAPQRAQSAMGPSKVCPICLAPSLYPRSVQFSTPTRASTLQPLIQTRLSLIRRCEHLAMFEKERIGWNWFWITSCVENN